MANRRQIVDNKDLCIMLDCPDGESGYICNAYAIDGTHLCDVFMGDKHWGHSGDFRYGGGYYHFWWSSNIIKLPLYKC